MADGLAGGGISYAQGVGRSEHAEALAAARDAP